ncbi:hypothetical protein HZA56_19790 [Candidatus Poribacteria bacterium]|nr:hypothetical protein [Candidatus Poribacteria bacterium]
MLLANAADLAHLWRMAKKAKKSQFHQHISTFHRVAARHTNPLKGVSRKTYPTKPPKVG